MPTIVSFHQSKVTHATLHNELTACGLIMQAGQWHTHKRARVPGCPACRQQLARLEHLVAVWPTLGNQPRSLIQRDVEAEFKRDDEARAADPKLQPHSAAPLCMAPGHGPAAVGISQAPVDWNGMTKKHQPKRTAGTKTDRIAASPPNDMRELVYALIDANRSLREHFEGTILMLAHHEVISQSRARELITSSGAVGVVSTKA